MDKTEQTIATPNFIGLLLEVEQDAMAAIQTGEKSTDELRLEFLGGKSELAKLTKQIRLVSQADRAQVGTVLNQVKEKIEEALAKHTSYKSDARTEEIDITAPGILPPMGHLHIVTQAINEITRIFERIGFTRVRHPEVDWDWYAFESLNMPPNHPARDEWETFFIDFPGKPSVIPSEVEGSLAHASSNKLRDSSHKHAQNDKFKNIVLTPHTSNGQVREMEKKKLPIRMINIAKCYRRQSDISHVPMFHQFEGLYVDKNVSISHLKGVLDYFVKQFFGPERKTRLRPFHFQFTEPSFEIDITCGVCNGRGCRLCKEGWLELGGAGMVHPVVLKNGGIDPDMYTGFAFGWGVERTAMMKSNTQLDDIRLLYGNDIRFLEQF